MRFHLQAFGSKRSQHDNQRIEARANVSRPEARPRGLTTDPKLRPLGRVRCCGTG
jgi:hypothetical protein